MTELANRRLVDPRPTATRRWSIALTALLFCVCGGPAPVTTSPSGAPSGSSGSTAAQSTLAGLVWQPVAPLSVPRSHLGAVSAAERIYAIGGVVFGGVEPSSVVERYDPALDRWERAADLPVGLDHAAVAADGTHLFVFGGNFAAPSIRSFRFDLASGSWTAVAPLPAPRAAAAAAAIGGRIYVIGGLGSDRREVATALAYDPAADAWDRIADLPTPREHLAVVGYRGLVCALGGHFGRADQTTLVECYDPQRRTWSDLPPLQRPASDFAAVTIENEIWAVGDDVQVFDGTRWWSGPAMPRPRFGVAATVIGRSLYLIGGAARRPSAPGLVDRIVR